MILIPTNYKKTKPQFGALFFIGNSLFTHIETIVYFDPIVQMLLRLLIRN